MSEQTVLISGAGVAGPTLAYWLARHGFRPTVVERAVKPRSSGNPVDVRGAAVDVAEQMGIMPRLREAGSDVTDLSFVNDAGRRVGRISMRAMQGSAGSREVELPRGDLASILLEASRDVTEFLWNDSIATLSQDADGVDVTFERSEPRRFDLVVGTDGLHSTVRRLAFGPEADFVHHMGIYVGTMPVDGPIDHEREVVIHNAPGRAISIHPTRGRALAAFLFRGAATPDFDHRNTDQHKRMLTTAFAGGSWREPELLEQVQTTDDLYFDSVSQVRLSTWSKGRVALLGDAASSVSLFGDGSTLAMIGAFTLARELASAPHKQAFAAYEAEHRVLVEAKQRNVGSAAALLIPATRQGIAVRNLATWLSPLVAAAGSVRRKLAAA